VLITTAVATNGSSTHVIGVLTSVFASRKVAIWEAHHLHKSAGHSIAVGAPFPVWAFRHIRRARTERDGPLARGYFIEPTVFADVDPRSELGRNEVYGPVLAIMPFSSDAEAIEIANATAYGLSATASIDKAPSPSATTAASGGRGSRRPVLVDHSF
jgi:hypothetical protein